MATTRYLLPNHAQLTLGRTPVAAATSMAAARRLLVRPGVTGGAEEEDDADGRPGRWRVMTGVRSTFWALRGAPGAPRGSSYTVHMLDDHRTLKRVSTHAAATGCIPSSPGTPFGILGIRSSTDARQHKSLLFVPTARSNPNICPMKLPFFELSADTSTMRVLVARVCEISSLLLTTVLRRIFPSAPFSASMRLKTCPFTL
mmetsp:Transcript_4717/g.8062  ORF Transcript_4717/g.8062 Transcript_4717/m.8062 type:complete len:201 (-) Transcript_4717:713-1315(-)